MRCLNLTCKKIPSIFLTQYDADTAALANHSKALKAIDYDDLRDKVVSWKNLFFCDPSANYAQAKPGTFRLVPRAERLPELRRDYQLMRDMYLNKPVTFDDILSTLTELEHRINLIKPFSLLRISCLKGSVYVKSGLYPE